MLPRPVVVASALGPPARRRWRWRASKAAARHRSTSAPPVPRPDWASRSTGGRSQAPHAFRRFVCGARGDTDTDAYVRGGAAGSTASSYPHARGTSTARRLPPDAVRRRHRFFKAARLQQRVTRGVFDMGQICPAKPTTVIFPCLISLAGLGVWPPRSISPSLLARAARS
jgi:hypothetical protein